MGEPEFKSCIDTGTGRCLEFTLIGPKEWWAYPYRLVRFGQGGDRNVTLNLDDETVIIHGRRLKPLLDGFHQQLIRSVRFMPRYEWFLQESRGWNGPRVERIEVEGRQSFPIR